jgi:3-phytase
VAGRTLAAVAVVAYLMAAACSQPTPSASAPSTPPSRVRTESVAHVAALRATEPMPMDVDDPAIWVNRADPARSLIFATMKVPAPDGALLMFGLDGKLRHTLTGPDRPNNVDVEYGLDLDGTPTDIVVLTERLGRRLRVYGIVGKGDGVRDISAGRMPILAGAEGDEGAPMGIGLFRRPRDGAIFAIVAPKSGPTNGYLWQYRLEDDGTGRVGATFVRRFG